MNFVRKIFSCSVVAATLLMLAGCGQKSNCNGISFGGSGSGSGTGGGVSTGGSVCGGSGNNSGGGGGGGSNTDLLYFVGGGNSIDGASLNSSGTFALLTGVTAPNIGSSSFAAPNIVIANKSFLYVPYHVNVNGTNQGFVAAFLISHSTGALSNISGSPFSTGTSGADSAAMDPKGRFLFVGDQVSGSVASFQINSSSGALTPAPGSPLVDPLTGPVEMDVDGSGNYLYFTQGSVSTYTVEYFIDQNTGALSAAGQFQLIASRVRTEPSGKYLFAVGSPSGGIDVYSIKSGTGNLLLLNSYATAASCYEMTVSPNGKFLYAFAKAGQTAEPMEGFSLDVNGVLTPLPNSPFKTIPGQFAGQFDQGGTHMFTSTLNGFSVLSMDTNTGTPTNPTPDLSVAATPFFAVTQ
jgi:6-phosphogluconolactonase (cycloisomerase 2 family)